MADRGPALLYWDLPMHVKSASQANFSAMARILASPTTEAKPHAVALGRRKFWGKLPLVAVALAWPLATRGHAASLYFALPVSLATAQLERPAAGMQTVSDAEDAAQATTQRMDSIERAYSFLYAQTDRLMDVVTVLGRPGESQYYPAVTGDAKAVTIMASDLAERAIRRQQQQPAPSLRSEGVIRQRMGGRLFPLPDGQLGPLARAKPKRRNEDHLLGTRG